MSTTFVKVIPKGQAFNSFEWTPWICGPNDNADQTRALAANRFVRNSGGLLPGQSLTLQVYSYGEDDPKHPDGTPKSCWMDEIKFTNDN